MFVWTMVQCLSVPCQTLGYKTKVFGKHGLCVRDTRHVYHFCHFQNPLASVDRMPIRHFRSFRQTRCFRQVVQTPLARNPIFSPVLQGASGCHRLRVPSPSALLPNVWEVLSWFAGATPRKKPSKISVPKNERSIGPSAPAQNPKTPIKKQMRLKLYMNVF